MGTARIKTALHWLIDQGSTGLAPVTADRVRLSNAVSLTLTLVAGLATLQYVVWVPHALLAGIQFGFAALHGLGLLWTRLRWLEFARVWICTAYLFDIGFFAAVVLPLNTGVGLFLLLTPVFAILIYEPGRQLPKYGATVITLLAYAAVLANAGGSRWLALDDHSILLANYLNFATCLIGLMVGAHLMSFDRLKTEGHLSRLAATDPLTGLWNRRAVLGQGKRLVRERREECAPLALIMVDIDRFKVINDNHGHNLGDRVIARVAATLVESLGHDDIAGRYGGEEFMILLPGTTAEQAWRVAEDLRQRIAGETVGDEDQSLACTVSLGVAGAGADADVRTLEQLVGRADAALYRAKGEGRDRAVLADPVPTGPAPAEGVNRQRA